MPIDFATGGSTYFTKPPRSIITYDTVSGCPPTRNTNTAICSTSITLSVTASLIVEGKLIRNNGANGAPARCDLSLYVSTGQVSRTLDYNDGLGSDWQQHSLIWMGTLSAGTHTLYMYSDNCASVWGCTSPWGHLQILIFE
jgi:hypothetical protein